MCNASVAHIIFEGKVAVGVKTTDGRIFNAEEIGMLHAVSKMI